MEKRKPDDLCDEPLGIVIYRGAVILNGPGNVALAMTADAAAKSGKKLTAAAERARRVRASGRT